jgi:hypothetical protein
MDWNKACLRTKLWIFDGSVLGPIFLCAVVFHVLTIVFLLMYALVNVYINWKGRTMPWVLKTFRSILRNRVILARPPSYWRRIKR